MASTGHSIINYNCHGNHGGFGDENELFVNEGGYMFNFANFTFCVFTDAWYPDHFLKNPLSAPLALTVSII